MGYEERKREIMEGERETREMGVKEVGRQEGVTRKGANRKKVLLFQSPPLNSIPSSGWCQPGSATTATYKSPPGGRGSRFTRSGAAPSSFTNILYKKHAPLHPKFFACLIH